MNPPQNVRIIRADGTVIPCGVKYLGRTLDKDGVPVEEWAAVTEYRMNIEAGDTVAIGVLPPRCSITVCPTRLT